MKPINIAIVGASGFVGLRATELFSSKSGWKVRPIVRSPSSLALLSRQFLDWRIANPLCQEQLVDALAGCSVCVHAAMGDPAQIVQMAEVAYKACARACVKRLIWISSASAHGQNAPAGTDEMTPLNDDHPLAYNNAKVRAEWVLEKLSGDLRVEVVRLRPSVVYGPRSRWIANVVDDLHLGRAAWLNGGQGICNGLYVDNLIEYIARAATSPEIAGHAILLRDNEEITWRDFMFPIARHLGFTDSSFYDATMPEVVSEKSNILSAIVASGIYRKHGSRIPGGIKHYIKTFSKIWKPESPDISTTRGRSKPTPILSTEMALLQESGWQIPLKKAKRILSYSPHVTFNEGIKRSLSWIDFIR